MGNEFLLQDRMALVTGGSRGIGFAIAEAFVAAGARVVVTARGEEALREAAGRLGPNALAMPCDAGDVAQVAETIERTWALAPIDILVNNAGISPYYKRVEHVTPEEWDAVMDVNARGLYFGCAEVAKRMMAEERAGSIINISSISGVAPLERLGVYAASKAAVHQLTRVMALEWAARGIRVNAIAPGWTETDFTNDLFASRHGDALKADIPMRRLAAPSDIAGAAVFLASDAGRYVTGVVLPVDGGRALR